MKKLYAIAMTIVLSAGMIGCGNTKAVTGNTSSAAVQTSGKETEASGKTVEITMPTYLAGENEGAKFFLPEIERFNKKYEGKYKIDIEEVPQASYADKIKQLAQQNKLPVIVHAPGSGGIDKQWFDSVIVANNMAYDLTDFANKHPETKANWIDKSVTYCTTKDGKLVVKPSAVIKPVGLYYNTTMYQPAKNVQDMTMDEFAKSLGDNKIAFQTADNGWTTGLLLSALIANQPEGNDYLAQYADDKLYDYTDSRIVNAVAELQKIMQSNASANSIGAAYADAANSFMSKGAGIICNGSWMATDFTDASKDKWGNGFQGSDVKASFYPGNVALANENMYGEFWISNSATTEEKQLAEAFFEFRDSQDEVEQLILAEGGIAPKLTYSDSFLQKQKESPVLYELSQSITDQTVYAENILNVMPSSVADTEFGKLLPKLADGTLTADQFCTELTQKAQAAK